MNRWYRPIRFLRALLVLGVSILVLTASNVGAASKGKISFTLQDIELSEIMNMLSRQERVNILVSEGVEGKVSINLYDVDLNQAIRAIASAAGFAVEFRDGSYFIVDRDEAGKYAQGGLTQVKAFKVQYSSPDTVQDILKKHLSHYGKITTLEERNMLIVEDLPPFLETVEKILAEVDREPKQILIEAKILEVTLRDAESFGIDWAKFFTSDGGSGAVGIQGLASPNSPGLFFELATSNVQLLLDALKQRGRLHTLSSPTLLALENQEATAIIGENTGYRVTTTINQVTTESIEFLESGVILKVKPNVDRDGQIMLEVHPEISTATVSDDGIPSKKTTNVTTKMLVPDGQTIFIGGLISRVMDETREGVPVLGDIPGVGLLFSNKAINTVNIETVVLITPKIIDSDYVKRTAEHVRKTEKIDQALSQSAAKTDAKMDELNSKQFGFINEDPKQSTEWENIDLLEDY